MTTISILPESPSDSEMKYRAIAGQRHSLGKTPGEALDSITAQLSEEESGTLLVVQQLRPDCFFAESQQKRLAELMNRWRTARDQGTSLPANESVELEQLVAAELDATAKRAMSQ